MPADLVFINGQVVTMDDRGSVHQALAVEGERILAVGSNEEALAHRNGRTRVLDLKGRALLPGLIDAHAHLVEYGLFRMAINIRYPAVRSIADIQALVREEASRRAPGEWIIGRGYDQRKLAEGRHPNRWDLDAAAPQHPVVLRRVCGHISVVNSRAMEALGITEETPDPPGGRLGRDAQGRFDGLLYESAQALASPAITPTQERLRQALLEAGRGFLSYGITTVHDAGGHAGEQLRALSQLRGGQLKLRVYNFVMDFDDPLGYLDRCIAAGLATGLGDLWLRVGPFKLVSDGSTSGPTAATRQPYDSNPQDRGILYFPQEELDRAFRRAHSAGLQVTAHAVGDRAIEMVLNAIQRALEGEPRPDPRPRIEHCALLDPALIARIKALGVVPVAQPVFFHEFGDGYLRDYGRRTRYMFPCRSLLEAGVPVAASSDCPVTTNDPFLGMYEAMTRRTMGGQEVYPEEGVDLMGALRMYTRNGAYAGFEEGLKGSLEPGKLADLAVLSRPILGLPPEEVRSLRAEITVVGGEIVHDTGQVAG